MSTTPHWKSLRCCWLFSLAVVTSSCMSPKGTWRVERHSIEPWTSVPRQFFSRIVSCAASQTSLSKSSTSSQRSFWTLVPRTEVWDWARSSTIELLMSLILRSVIFPSMSSSSGSVARSARRCVCIRLAWSSDPARIRISIPGLKIMSRRVAMAA